jgi:MFS family permease
VFIDLLGLRLVIPFLPAMARRLGAGDFVATMPGAVYSIMQFLFIPIWGACPIGSGRRPVLLWSIAATAVGHGVAWARRRRCCCCSRRARSAASPPPTSPSRRPTSPT